MFVGSFAISLTLLSSLFSVDAKGDHWSLYKHLGNLTPYNKLSVPKGIHETLPRDCEVVQVMLMGRHGSRFPSTYELPNIQKLVYKLGNSSEAIKKARLPKELHFLKKGYTSSLGSDELTAPGRSQLFTHGVDFRLKYPHLEATSVLAGLYGRVVESAQWFAQGYFGRRWADLNATMFSTIAEDEKTVSWITPQFTCPKWSFTYGSESTKKWSSLYLPKITRRLNEGVPGVEFTDDETRGALYACAYDKAAFGVSPWCDFFTKEEILNYEYELDLMLNGGFGYGLPGDMGLVLGSLYVNKLLERFSNSTGDAATVYLEFGHDFTIAGALTGFGLAKDVPQLSPTGPVDPDRKWRTSNHVMFGAQMVWEKFTCRSSKFKGPQIRLLLNGSPFPLTICSDMNKKYGTCAFDDFVKANAFAQNIKWGDETWTAACGVSKLHNETSSTFLIQT